MQDGSGTLDAEEVRQIMEQLGYNDPSHSDVVDLLIKCADTDGDGEVSIDEVR